MCIATQTGVWIGRCTGADRWVGRQTKKQTNRQISGQTSRQTGRQTDSQVALSESNPLMWVVYWCPSPSFLAHRC